MSQQISETTIRELLCGSQTHATYIHIDTHLVSVILKPVDASGIAVPVPACDSLLCLLSLLLSKWLLKSHMNRLHFLFYCMSGKHWEHRDTSPPDEAANALV